MSYHGLITVAAARTTVITAATAAVAAAVAATAFVTAAAAAAATRTTAIAATATAITTTAAAVEAATATARALALIGLFYNQGLFTQRNIVQVFDGITAVLLVYHFHKSKAAAFPCFFIHSYFSRRDRTKFFKNFYQLVVKQIVRKAGYKKFHTES